MKNSINRGMLVLVGLIAILLIIHLIHLSNGDETADDIHHHQMGQHQSSKEQGNAEQADQLKQTSEAAIVQQVDNASTLYQQKALKTIQLAEQRRLNKPKLVSELTPEQYDSYQALKQQTLLRLKSVQQQLNELNQGQLSAADKGQRAQLKQQFAQLTQEYNKLVLPLSRHDIQNRRLASP